jgi:hypothetical protein
MTGFGTLYCNSGTYQTLTAPTISGTIVLTFSGNVNWADIQNAYPATAAPTPHIITNSKVPVQRPADKMQIGGPALTMLEGQLATAIVEAKVITFSTLESGSAVGWFLAGPSNSYTLWYARTQQGARVGNTTTSVTPTGPTLGVLQRLGGTVAPAVYNTALNGAFSGTEYAFNPQIFPTGTTYYLGYSSQPNGSCNCWISQAVFYPYALTRPNLVTKTTLGVPWP